VGKQVGLISLLVKAEELYDKTEYLPALQLLKKFRNNIETASVTDKLKYFNLAGLACFQTGNLSEAEVYFKERLSLSEQVSIPSAIWVSCDNLSSVYISMNKPEEAVKLLLHSIALKEKENNTVDLGRNLLQLSGIYLSLENLEYGKQFLKKAGTYIKLHKQNFLEGHWYFTKAGLARQEKQTKLSVKYYKLAIDSFTEVNEPLMLNRTLSNMGALYQEIRNFKDAAIVFKQALVIAEEHKMEIDIVSLKLALANSSYYMGNYILCARQLKEAEPLLQKSSTTSIRRDFLELYAMNEKALGNYENSLKYYEEFMEVYRTLYHEKQTHAVIEMQAKYEAEKKERELQKAELQKVESELKALRAQMNPHFMFNALSSIRKQILKGDTEIADDYIVRFSKLLRLILDSTRTPLVKLSDNLSMLELYMQIEQNRQNNKFKYAIKLPAQLKAADVYIPGMVLQPIIENSIIHGLFPKQDGKGLLTVSFKKIPKALRISISDNGVGRNSASTKPHQSHALNIVKETLALAWGDNRKEYLTITDLKDRKGKPAGTQVELLLPLHLKP
jgi:hypothetical protein